MYKEKEYTITVLLFTAYHDAFAGPMSMEVDLCYSQGDASLLQVQGKFNLFHHVHVYASVKCHFALLL